jgi:RimJ/RimL family protein N-acetyltransferase
MSAADPVAAERTTPRLRLRPITAALVDDLWELHQDPGIAAWYGGAWSVEHSAAAAAAMQRSWASGGLGKWLAYDGVTGELIGRGGPSRTDVLDREDVEIGWAVRQRFWRRGYATEIGRASLDFIDQTTDADTVIAFTEVHNRGSRAVMERLGMVYDREIRRPGLVEGVEGVRDDARFAVYSSNRASRRLNHAE